MWGCRVAALSGCRCPCMNPCMNQKHEHAPPQVTAHEPHLLEALARVAAQEMGGRIQCDWCGMKVSMRIYVCILGRGIPRLSSPLDTGNGSLVVSTACQQPAAPQCCCLRTGLYCRA